MRELYVARLVAHTKGSGKSPNMPASNLQVYGSCMIRTQEQMFDIVWDKLFAWCLFPYAAIVIKVLPEYIEPFNALLFHAVGVGCCFLSFYTINRFMFDLRQVHIRSAIVCCVGWPIVVMNILAAIVTYRWWQINGIAIFEDTIKNK